LVEGPIEPQHEITIVGACAFSQFRGDRKAQYQQAADAAYDRLADGGSVEKFKQLWRRPELAGKLIRLFPRIPPPPLPSPQYPAPASRLPAMQARSSRCRAPRLERGGGPSNWGGGPMARQAYRGRVEGDESYAVPEKFGAALLGGGRSFFPA